MKDALLFHNSISHNLNLNIHSNSIFNNNSFNNSHSNRHHNNLYKFRINQHFNSQQMIQVTSMPCLTTGRIETESIVIPINAETVEMQRILVRCAPLRIRNATLVELEDI